jgi:hypothetical protein
MGHGTVYPEVNSENQIVGYVGTVTDITERKQGGSNFKERLLRNDNK